MFLGLLHTKNAKMDTKQYIGKQKDIKKTCIMNVFIISQEPQGKKRKKLVNMEKFLRHQNSGRIQ